MVAALYRRYRPEAFTEMIGQSQVTDPLMTALRTGRIGHAYLFSGPRGCGKTTSARILARCLNCAEGPTDSPCGVCPSCIELSRDGGGSLDVVEIDAASHGGVDDARDLRERAVFAPARDRFKIFIIDEAHMVTPAGFNALLKIVEEPPPHVKFVFATTEPDKVIGTIRSRTHHYPFRLIAPGTLIDYVQSLCDSEGVQVEPGVLPLVVRAGGGSVRDTLSILDQLIAGSEGTLVTADRAAGLLGFTHSELLDDVVTAFGARDSAAAFTATDRVVQTGQDPRRFVEDLLERLRDLIVVGATTVDGAAAVFRGVPHDQLTRMFEQSRSFGPGELSHTADVVSNALDKMTGATAPRLQLELMVARVLVAQEQRGSASAGGSASQPPVQQAQRGSQGHGAPVSQAAPQDRNAPARQQPSTPAVPQADPLAALAAARGAAMEQPAAPGSPQGPTPRSQSVPAPAQQAQTPPQAQNAPSPSPGTRQGGDPQQPNAAQTAASIREFLREDAAGAPAIGEQTPTEPQQTERNQQPQPESNARVQQQPAASAAAPTSAPDLPGESHPNTGAASFGRPISDVLSAAQIEGIGRDNAFQARPDQATPPQVAPAASATPASAPQGAPQPAQQSSEPQPSEPQASARQQASAPEQASAAQQPGDQPQNDSSDALEEAEEHTSPGGFEDLLELWPELLEDILQTDRDAWNAVRAVTPLALEGDVLAVGLVSESDLTAFKTAGANPLREAILSATGLSVRYKPKHMPAGGAPRETGEPAPQRPGQDSSDSEEPHPAGSRSSSPDPSDPVARAAARLSSMGIAPGSGGTRPPSPQTLPGAGEGALGPALAAPAWADPIPEASAENTARASDTPETPTAVAPNDDSASERIEASENTEASQGAGTPVSAETETSGTSREQSEEEIAPPLSTDGVGYGDAPDPEPFDDYSAPYPDSDPYGEAATPPQYSEAEPEPAQGRAVQGHSQVQASPPAVQHTAPSGSAPPHTAAQPQNQAAAALAAALAMPSGTQQTKSSSDPETDEKRSKPTFTRYGEAVVREVLKARFVEERPLPGREQQ